MGECLYQKIPAHKRKFLPHKVHTMTGAEVAVGVTVGAAAVGIYYIMKDSEDVKGASRTVKHGAKVAYERASEYAGRAAFHVVMSFKKLKKCIQKLCSPAAETGTEEEQRALFVREKSSSIEGLISEDTIKLDPAASPFIPAPDHDKAMRITFADSMPDTPVSSNMPQEEDADIQSASPSVQRRSSIDNFSEVVEQPQDEHAAEPDATVEEEQLQLA